MMKNQSKKIISIMLMASLILAAVVLALPNAAGKAAATDITATTPTIEQSGQPGATLYFPITISNGAATAVSLDIKCDIAGVDCSSSSTTQTSISPTPVAIAANSSATIMVAVTIKSTAAVGTSEILSIRYFDGIDEATTSSLIVHVSNPTASGANRPQLGVSTYTFDAKVAKVGSKLRLSIIMENRGPVSSYNNTVTFEGEGFFPQGSGGMQYVQNIEPGGKVTFNQDFMVGDALDYIETATIKATAVYLDAAGKSYTDVFTISVPVTSGVNSGATATPKTTSRPKLVITKNTTDIDPLQPGSIFELSLNVKNLGTTDAKNVIMVLGGGATTYSDTGTPQPGTGADLTNFAPLGSSNIVVVGDIAQGAETTIKLKLVVNVTTVPGAYTLKTSFAFTDSSAKNFTDDQVITLLVYQLPQVEVNFYRDPGMMTAGMPNTLPLQVTNLGKKSTVLGNMTVKIEGMDVTNNTALVGALDPGGYFTLDSEIMPVAEGPLEVNVIINYTDDFNAPREITQTLNLQVMPAPIFTPDPNMGPDGLPINQPEVETFWGKIGRFFKGLFGLDSGVKEPATSGTSTEVPIETGPIISGGKG
jgi:hypothetical protein